MKKALIHIGSGKTGTSSIQSALAKISSEKKISFSYPLIHGHGHQAIEVLFKDYKRLSRGLKTKFEKTGGYEKFKDSFDNSLSYYAKNNLLISSEFMFNFKFEEVVKLRDYLEAKGFDTFRVLIYLRSPPSYYISYVQQKIKAAYSIPSPFDFKLGYARSINNWHRVFGDNLCVREFDKSKMLKGDVLEDFSTIVNSFFEENVLLRAKASNESVSSEGMVVLQEFRRMFFHDREDRFAKESTLLLKKIQEVEKENAGTKPRLNREYSKVIVQNGLEDILVAKSFGVFDDFDVDKLMACSDISGINEGFSGNVKKLLDCFDENHYKYILHRLIYDSLL